MRQIDKNKILSKNYKNWVDSLGSNHPKYTSSNRYYNEIRMSLFYCQKGLCAYTEELLCDPKLILLENWSDEEYITDLTEEDLVNGDLEHFDSSLKKEQGYLWDNLFFVNSNINRSVKGTKPIKMILKPDSPQYDPYKYLQFDDEINIFFPNINLIDEEKIDVQYMIDTLGINKNSFKRDYKLEDLKERFNLGLTIKEPVEFQTALKMTLATLESEAIES